MRWSGGARVPGAFGDIGWAFEYNDRSGRFQCFYCGAAESNAPAPGRFFWFEKCVTLPELIKTMSATGGPHSAFDEAKIFEVADAQSDAALQTVNQLATAPDEMFSRTNPLEHTREILTRYGVRSLAHTHGFHAPFLWYNMLPGRSVPVRKLAIHIYQLRAAQQAAEETYTPAWIEDHARKIAQNDSEVRSVGECFVCRTGAKFVVALTVAVNPAFSVGEGRIVAERLEQAIRTGTPPAGHVFIQVEPFEKLD